MRRPSQRARVIVGLALVGLLAGCTSGHSAKPSPSQTGVAASVRPGTADALPSVVLTGRQGPALGVPMAHDGRMERFLLDSGAFTVSRAPSWLHPAEPMSRVLVAMKEADPFAFSSPELIHPVVGYGLVTIEARYWKQPAYNNTPAWVVAYEDNRPSSCPAMGPPASLPPPPTPPLPLHHYTVFVLPDAETWAVTFVERNRARCGGGVVPSAATLAQSSTFVHWHVVSRHGISVTVGYTIRACADDGMYTSGGDRNAEFIAIAQAVPFGHPPNCSGVRQRTKTFELPSETVQLRPPRSGPAIF
jgi:hypothetical protein